MPFLLDLTNPRISQCIQQSGFSMIHVAHNRDDRRSRFEHVFLGKRPWKHIFLYQFLLKFIHRFGYKLHAVPAPPQGLLEEVDVRNFCVRVANQAQEYVRDIVGISAEELETVEW